MFRTGYSKIHKISKRNVFNNKKNRKSKKINNYKEGGKPKVDGNAYTYFIIAHGNMSEYLPPIKVPINGSIITIMDVNKQINFPITNQIVEFYQNGNRLFKKMDRSKDRTEIAESFIREKLGPIEIDKQGRPNKTNIRNHIEGSTMNDMTISFYPNGDTGAEEYTGIIRYNHTTGQTEHYNIHILKHVENILQQTYGKLTLKLLLHYLFNTSSPDEQIVFDNQVTIIPLMCRVFADKLLEDENEQLLVRTASTKADQVESPHGITELDAETLSSMQSINIAKKVWLGKGTKVLFADGNTAIINGFYPIDSVGCVHIDFMVDAPILDEDVYVFIKDLDTAPELNGKIGIIQGDFNPELKKWTVMVDDIVIDISPQNLLASKIKTGSKVVIDGLKSRGDLNGLTGKITEMFDNSSKRWGVKVKGEDISLRTDNLKIPKEEDKIISIHREIVIDVILDDGKVDSSFP